SDKVGQVRGTLLINGQPPANSDYYITLISTLNPSASVTTQPQSTMTGPGPAPTSPLPPGSFRLLFPGGRAIGRVTAMGNLLATFEIDVVAGTEIDIGNPVDPPEDPAPVAHVGGPYGGAEGGTITFDGSASTGATSYSWNFGDGSPAGTGAQPTHVYADNGTYNVVLTVTNADGETATAQAVVVISNSAPTAQFIAGGPVTEGSVFTLQLQNASDTPADMSGLQFSFDCGMGYDAWGAATSASCSTTDDGSRTVRARVRDKDGGTSEYTSMVSVTNVAPSILMPATATILQGDTWAASGSFTDPGQDSWTATVDYGGGASPLTLGGKSFALSRQFSQPGTYTVTVVVTDDDGGSSTGTTTVVVRSLGDAIGDLIATVRALIPATEAQSLTPTLDAAIRQLERGNTTAARNQLEAFVNKLRSNRGGGAISSTVAQQLIDAAQAIIGRL
ncbi:MAG TPA: PKD domain-containing protein, partial [Gemmatimonadaceae bacterium]|nr:PKD domain-containing protein [Gemmatimonadaceae bacterium]